MKEAAMLQHILPLFVVLLGGSASAAEVEFPTSKNAPIGAPWTRMGTHPYTGTLQQACSLLGLGKVPCANFISMMESNTCSRLQVTDDVVLDELLFSVDGIHKHRSRVKVQLGLTRTRWADVCQLDHTLFAGRFDGCGNPFKVVTAKPIELPVREPDEFQGEGFGGAWCPDGDPSCNQCH